MMAEESSDESAELVDKEEAVSAEKQFTSHQTGKLWSHRCRGFLQQYWRNELAIFNKSTVCLFILNPDNPFAFIDNDS